MPYSIFCVAQVLEITCFFHSLLQLCQPLCNVILFFTKMGITMTIIVMHRRD
jgi:hypothetical protein